MKFIYKLTFLVLLTGFSLQTSNAQVTMERRIEGGDGAFHLKEVQTILTSKDDTIKVMMVLPERLRPKGYGDIVLKENDEILMVNAKRVKTVQHNIRHNTKHTTHNNTQHTTHYTTHL